LAASLRRGLAARVAQVHCPRPRRPCPRAVVWPHASLRYTSHHGTWCDQTAVVWPHASLRYTGDARQPRGDAPWFGRTRRSGTLEPASSEQTNCRGLAARVAQVHFRCIASRTATCRGLAARVAQVHCPRRPRPRRVAVVWPHASLRYTR